MLIGPWPVLVALFDLFTFDGKCLSAGVVSTSTTSCSGLRHRKRNMYDFTPRAQQVLALARKEAERFNHNYVGTEHLLLGLIKLGQGAVLQLWRLDLVRGLLRCSDVPCPIDFRSV